MEAARSMTEAPSVEAKEMDLMAIRLRKRPRPSGDAPRARAQDDTTQAEHAAMMTLAQTLQELASELPPESRLAAEFVDIARCIDVTGVLAAWRLESTAREFAEPVS
jgi:hypothetical protein